MRRRGQKRNAINFNYITESASVIEIKKIIISGIN